MDTLTLFARTTLAAGINATQLTASVAPGTGSKLGAITKNLVIWDSTNYKDATEAYANGAAAIYRMTSVSGDIITFAASGGVRAGQEGTTPLAHSTSGVVYVVEQNITPKLFSDLLAIAPRSGSKALTIVGDNDVTYAPPFSDDTGTNYALVITKCVNALGVSVSYEVTAKAKTKFTINVGEAATVEYMATPYSSGSDGGANERGVITLTDAATIAVDADITRTGIVTLGGNRTLGNPSGAPLEAQLLQIRVRQDGTGSRTLAYDTKYRFGTDVTLPVLTTTINKTDYLLFAYNAIDDKWDCVAVAKGY